MKIEVIDNRVFFSEVKHGEVVSLNRKYYLRIFPIVDVTGQFINCIELPSGKPMAIEVNEKVTPENGKFIIIDN